MLEENFIHVFSVRQRYPTDWTIYHSVFYSIPPGNCNEQSSSSEGGKREYRIVLGIKTKLTQRV
jgi:hypothetical protein